MNLINVSDSQVEKDRLKNRKVLEALYGRQFERMPTNVGEGIASMGNAFAYRAAQNKALGPFPDAPGGQAPGFGTQIGNFFKIGKRGGLY